LQYLQSALLAGFEGGETRIFLPEMKFSKPYELHAIITTEANALVTGAFMSPADYTRRLGDEPDPHDLMRPFPLHLMRLWPISTQVNKPENHDPSIVEPVKLATDAA
jgi:putative SOS response-associated peptidase YedK